MNELLIIDNLKSSFRYLGITVSAVSAAISLDITIRQFVAGVYNYMFFAALLLLILSVILFLCFAIWDKKTLLKINNMQLVSNLQGEKSLNIEWNEISGIGIGLSSLVFNTKAAKTYTLDMGTLRYNDIKDIKSKIIEICESKSIEFYNI
ncbi:hypothetical protein D0T53_11630 [Dysgonomonas sp. 216]|uniref:hypothetical protein n=1 Tax=Dysgonomonas sp. 216 TaxID=2302934 RepID=UPI0013D7EA7F|nr:hypothetical protein [Dysgonomonas sp. 216]NDW19556.1 hypothetical protein [Dysgonomonas sp. 216]